MRDPSGDTRGNAVKCAMSHTRVVSARPGGLGLKPVSQSHRFVAFGDDPRLPFLRQALATKELADARSTRHDRSKASRATSHPGGHRLRTVSLRHVIDEEAAVHVVTIERPRSRIGLGFIQMRAAGLEQCRTQRLRKLRTADPPAIGQARFVVRREPLDQSVAIEQVRERQLAAAEHPSQHSPAAARFVEMEDVRELVSREQFDRIARVEQITLDRRVRKRDDAVRRKRRRRAVEDIALVNEY